MLTFRAGSGDYWQLRYREDNRDAGVPPLRSLDRGLDSPPSDGRAASLVAYSYLLYEDTRVRYALLSFSCTLLVTEQPGGCIVHSREIESFVVSP